MTNQAIRTVLVIEDHPSISRLIDFHLKRLGFRVRLGADGEQALEALQESPPDLIILDVMLPFHSGYEVVAE
jgi:two-component system alkaline phosphatase synthesis response regulator PhoP